MANITARRPLFYLLGDSLTQMGGQMYDEGWGILLQHEYERSADFVNRGLGGYDTRMFLTHGMPVLREELRSVYKPAFITVWFGANDAALVDGPSNKQHVPLDDYKKNLVAILEELHELVPEAKILLISPPPVDDAKRREIGEELAGEKLTGPLDRTNEQAGRYANACGDVAAQVEGVTLLDMHAYLMETYPNDVERARLLSDGLHFTKEGNRVVFNQIKAYAEKLLSPSPLPAEILSWKDKVERLMVQPNMSGMSFSGSMSGSVSGSISMPPGSSFSLTASSSPMNGSYNDLSFFGSVSELVEVSMQSGILAPAASDPHSHANSHGHRLSASQTPPPRGKFQARVRSIRQRNRSGVSIADGSLSYYVVDLLKDFPKVPSSIVWLTIREKLREKRKAFRAEIYRYKLELFHYQQHQEQIKHMHVLDKFRDFFTLERPRRPHFRSLISNRKMESLIRSTVEQVKNSTPANPRILLDSTKL